MKFTGIMGRFSYNDLQNPEFSGRNKPSEAMKCKKDNCLGRCALLARLPADETIQCSLKCLPKNSGYTLRISIIKTKKLNRINIWMRT